MRFARFTFGFLVFLFMLAPEISSGGPEATQRRAMGFGDFAEINGMFVGIRGELGPASFFRGLHAVEQKGRTLVLNAEGEVRFFPERVTITLLLMGPIPKALERTPSPSFDPQYMEDLRFTAEWKRGLDLRPVKQFRVLTASASQPPDLGPFFPDFRDCWIYDFVLEDSAVPIDDHLILYIISPENKRLARLSAHL
jgi:hypothetical protein